MEILVAPRAGQSGKNVVGSYPLIAEIEVRFVFRVEVVVDSPVVLLAIAGGLAHAKQIVETAEATNIAVASQIQAVDARERTICIREVIRRRHQCVGPRD